MKSTNIISFTLLLTCLIIRPIQSTNPNSPRQIETILLVDDDGGPDNGGIYTNVRSYYTQALGEAGYSYTLFTVPWTNPPSNGPIFSVMEDYDCVIWFTGETYGGGIPGRRDVLTLVDENNLTNYLDQGGTLFLNAQDYLYDAYMSAGEFHQGQFPYDYLGISSVLQDVFNPPNSVAGTLGSYAQGLNYSVIDPYPSATIWADSLAPRQHNLLCVNGTQKACAVQFHSNDFYTVFSTCGVEGLVNGAYQVSAYVDAILTGFGAAGVITTQEPTVVTGYLLSQNYPNPFNPSTDIRYQLPVNGKVTLTVYNALGQEVAQLINENQPAGAYRVTWDANSLPSGIYFYQLKANNFQDVRRMMLLK